MQSALDARLRRALSARRNPKPRLNTQFSRSQLVENARFALQREQAAI